MKKYLCIAAAILVLSGCFTGCGRKNVSDDPNGRITDPTVVTTAPIPEPTMTTMPTVPTTPPTTRPTESNNGSIHPSTGATDGMEPTTDPSLIPDTGDAPMDNARGRRFRPLP